MQEVHSTLHLPSVLDSRLERFPLSRRDYKLLHATILIVAPDDSLIACDLNLESILQRI